MKQSCIWRPRPVFYNILITIYQATKPKLKFPAASAFEAILIGRSIVGIQAGDIMRVATFLKGLPNVMAGRIQAVAFGEQCPALLHAAAFEPSISGIALIKAPVSYFNITQTMLYGYSSSFAWGVAGALTAYDLPDLAACVAPRKLAFIGLLDGHKKPAIKNIIVDQMNFPESVYANSNSGNLKIMPIPEGGVSNALIEWLEE